MDELLLKYLDYFKKLNRGFNPGFGKAPHKPILLLSIIDISERGLLNSNRFGITPELVLRFKEYFIALVDTGHHDNFALPFFHMKSEPFYRLIPRVGFERKFDKMKSVKSIYKLIEIIAFAEIDKELFELLQIQSYRIIIKEFLLDSYFFRNKSNIKINAQGYLENLIEHEILNESRVEYVLKLNSIKAKLEDANFEEELFVRGGVFKKTVPKIYDYTCCISGLKIISNHNFQLVDACHIIPFSQSQDDTISNGISLSPTLHRAFDRGLITIDSNYRIKISSSIIQSESTKELLNLSGSPIRLPKHEKYKPSAEALKWHNQEVFLG
ncbi:MULTISPECIES: HNH endonuclease [unclassified Leeuwenhoekiella]|uniref:HNH endonuclease n=1 Tax=unclassified Leeuwenhoekiella TaxID=2615029 RepID=UPI000C586000|nr:MULTISPECIES: HNH endonuclease [unclassified Leeuwenhoekiella]MAW96140.1 HNH endonuclease [Leeuwenhoekiella sp.]MBA80134.1 HNH endonuclease [Leeuwenhoekiella sp.]|tara:strand:+ start:39040 stop:40017 length:978 start_codon:yes stop_codon:yes gene_type:complete